MAQDLGIDIFKQHEACEWFLGRAKPPVFGDDEVVRVLQWNVLAEGLSNDGFLVQDSLSEGEEAYDFVHMVHEVASAKTNAKHAEDTKDGGSNLEVPLLSYEFVKRCRTPLR